MSEFLKSLNPSKFLSSSVVLEILFISTHVKMVSITAAIILYYARKLPRKFEFSGSWFFEKNKFPL
jgi:hypothetical protein